MTARESVSTNGDSAELATGAEALGQALDSDARSEEIALEIIARQLEGGIDSETWNAVGDRLMIYLGEGANVIAPIVAAPDSSEALAALERHASPRTIAFVRRLVANYGNELRKSRDLSGLSPHEWTYITREVYHDVIDGRHVLRLRIDKADGESITIEGAADSILNLTRSFIVTLRWVGSREAFSEDMIGSFLAEVEPFVELLRAPPGEPTPAEAEPSAA